MQDDIPFEIIVSAAVVIILTHRSITPEKSCVVFSKKSKALANQTEREISKSANLSLSNL